MEGIADQQSAIPSIAYATRGGTNNDNHSRDYSSPQRIDHHASNQFRIKVRRLLRHTLICLGNIAYLPDPCRIEEQRELSFSCLYCLKSLLCISCIAKVRSCRGIFRANT